MIGYDTIADLSAAYDARHVSPVEITSVLLEQAERLNPVFHAFLRLEPEHALHQARLAEQRQMAGRRLGPLDGIPIAHKDNFDTAGIVTTANSARYAARVPVRDAAVVTALALAGCVTLGKLACYETAFAGPDFDLPWPPPRNPVTHSSMARACLMKAKVSPTAVMIAMILRRCLKKCLSAVHQLLLFPRTQFNIGPSPVSTLRFCVPTAFLKVV